MDGEGLEKDGNVNIFCTLKSFSFNTAVTGFVFLLSVPGNLKLGDSGKVEDGVNRVH